VLVMGCSTNNLGVGQVSLLHLGGNVGMVWVGLESYASAAITSGQSLTTGTHIVSISIDKTVEIQVASADTIRVHNGNASSRAGNVTLIW
jgi:hypothetical protein